MGISRKKEPDITPHILNESEAVSRLASFFEWYRNLCFPNVYCGGGEMDLCVVTPARYMWEVEVKLSLSDWKADALKSKWKDKDRQYVSRFYYAVPTNLLDSIPEFVPPEAGIIEIYWHDYWGYRVQLHRSCTLPRGKKITEKQKAQLMSKIYFRYWSNRIRKGN